MKNAGRKYFERAPYFLSFFRCEYLNYFAWLMRAQILHDEICNLHSELIQVVTFNPKLRCEPSQLLSVFYLVGSLSLRCCSERSRCFNGVIGICCGSKHVLENEIPDDHTSGVNATGTIRVLLRYPAGSHAAELAAQTLRAERASRPLRIKSVNNVRHSSSVNLLVRCVYAHMLAHMLILMIMRIMTSLSAHALHVYALVRI